MSITRTAPTPCPVCGKRLNAMGTPDGEAATPAVGDWTICNGCLSWLIILEAGGLRPITSAEDEAQTAVDRAYHSIVRERVRLAFHEKRNEG